jgi:ankyrin repeat protein
VLRLLSIMCVAARAEHHVLRLLSIMCCAVRLWRLLLGHGANIHATDRHLSRTSLHIASAMGHDGAVRALLRRGALLDIPDAGGQRR